MNKKTLIGLLVFLFGFGGYYYFQTHQKLEVTNFEECVEAGHEVMESFPRKCEADGEIFTEGIGNVLEKEDKITISTPRPNDEVFSPLYIKGEARGTWFFEASFSAKLLDENDEEIASSVVMTPKEWMTEDFVPYSAEMEFEMPETDEATLVLERANPSGQEQNAEELRVPVKFQK